MGLKVTTAENNHPVLWIHDVIGEIYGGISPLDVRDALKDIPDVQDVDVRINSPGGSFPDSIAIHSILTRRKGATHCIVDGQACSGGSIVAMAGKTVTMHTGSWLMFHEARGTLYDATAEAMMESAERITAINDQLVSIYKPRWKGTGDELRAALKIETWLRDTEAVEFGLADSVDGGMALAAYVDPERFGYKNMPEIILAAKADAEKALEPIGKIVEELFPEIGDRLLLAGALRAEAEAEAEAT